MTAEAPLVDSHFHVYTQALPLSATAWHRPTEDAATETLIETLDAHGVSFGVISAASLYGDYNDYSLRALKQHRRLRATAIVDPEISLHELELLDAAGFVGIRFQFRRVPTLPDLGGPTYRKLLHRIADLGWHVHVNCEGERLAPLLQAVEATGARLVVDHFGHPTPGLGTRCPGFQAVLAAVERGRTWVKLSAGYRQHDQALLPDLASQLVRVGGGERLLWGSDWPFAGFEDRIRYQDTVEALAEWVPDAAVRRRILGETPLRLYFARL
ncbi:amidohydrolase family protein [Humitalea sp. 24SJ18S-53]|uniref:amidohydrolase family protein n=1 Tax=Humitalea sp. 24SJ18S-53 TaxID=3422307 RepID=UPI003D679CFF